MSSASVLGHLLGGNASREVVFGAWCMVRTRSELTEPPRHRRCCVSFVGASHRAVRNLAVALANTNPTCLASPGTPFTIFVD